MRGKYDIIYLISNSAEFDVVWNPLKKYVYEELGRDQKKKGEEWYWSSWSDQRLIDLMDDQRKHITEQRRLGQNKSMCLGGMGGDGWPTHRSDPLQT